MSPQLAQSSQIDQIPKTYFKKRIEFLNTYKGWSARQPYIVLYGRPNGLKCHRLGCTTPKSIGTAVVRNRFRRRCRELFKKMDLSDFPKPMDFHVFVGNKRVKKEVFKDVSYPQFKEQMEKAFGRFAGFAKKPRHKSH